MLGKKLAAGQTNAWGAPSDDCDFPCKTWDLSIADLDVHVADKQLPCCSLNLSVRTRLRSYQLASTTKVHHICISVDLVLERWRQRASLKQVRVSQSQWNGTNSEWILPSMSATARNTGLRNSLVSLSRALALVSLCQLRSRWSRLSHIWPFAR